MSLTMVVPNDVQAGSYNSKFRFHGYGAHTSPPAYPVRFRYNTTPPAGVQCRNRVFDHHGQLVYEGPWHAPDASRYLAQFDLWAVVQGQPGEYLCDPEQTIATQPVYPAPVRLLTAAEPGPVPLWMPSTSFDYVYSQHAFGHARIEAPPPNAWPITDEPAPRVVEPYSTVIPGGPLLVNTRLFAHRLKYERRIYDARVRVSATERVTTPTAWADHLKYYDGCRKNLHTPLLDGPRNVGQRGWSVDCRIWPGGTGLYGLDLEGRLWARPVFPSGPLQTIAGRRIRPDLRPPYWGHNSPGDPALLQDKDWVLDHYEWIAPFTGMAPDTRAGVFYWLGLAVKWGATRMLDECFICDHDRHMILHVSAGPARQIRRLAGNADGTPGLLNGPKSCDLAPDGTLVVLNDGSNTLVTIDTATGVITPAASIATLTEADRVRCFSDGRLALTRELPGELWEVDRATGPVRRIAAQAQGSGGVRDNWAIAVDRHGACGPVDDIFTIRGTGGTSARWGRDGTARPSYFSSTRRYDGCLEGPMDVVSGTGGYVEALDVAAGAIAVLDMASASSHFITQRQPADRDPDITQYNAGLHVWKYVFATMPDTGDRCALAMVYGQHGNGTLGGAYAGGSWAALARLTDAGIIAWGVQHGLSAIDAAKLVYPIRWEHPTASPTPGDAESPDVPTGLTATATWSSSP